MHNHDHNHNHADENKKNKSVPEPELDAAGKSLSDALRISFVILKIIMLILIALFLASGITIIEPSEKAIVLHLGEIRGTGEKRLLGPGPHWVLPSPIDEVIKIPVEKKVNLSVDSFWYYQSEREKLDEAQGQKRSLNISEPLDPIRDGYTLTRSEVSIAESDVEGSDYNIIHCKLELIYRIDDPERFFKNMYVEIPQPGEIYFNVMVRSINPVLKDLADDAVVAAMVNYTIEDTINNQATISAHVKRLLQDKLTAIKSGIIVDSVQLSPITWPRQVDSAFLDSIKASQTSQKGISEAKGYAENTLSQTAGQASKELLEAIHNPNTDQKYVDELWANVAGESQNRLSEARAYRTKVVESAKANADYLTSILPEYRKRPQLVLQKIYQDAVESVLDKADEKILISPSEEAGKKEIRVMINRDPEIKKQEGEKK